MLAGLAGLAGHTGRLHNTVVGAERSGWAGSTEERTGHSGLFRETATSAEHALEDPSKSKTGPKLCPAALEPSILGCSSSRTDQRAGRDGSFLGLCQPDPNARVDRTLVPPSLGLANHGELAS